MLGSERQRGRVEGGGRAGEIAADIFVEGKNVLFRNGPLHIYDKADEAGRRRCRWRMQPSGMLRV